MCSLGLPPHKVGRCISLRCSKRKHTNKSIVGVGSRGDMWLEVVYQRRASRELTGDAYYVSAKVDLDRYIELGLLLDLDLPL